ncbi:hypothetical protein [Salinisphaera hydrothermalis]|uniref:hypothetical protein n=1 Tax=Salinisphaera hydrothermalis TaxID=563188 RepID=UPI00334186C2
MSGVPARYRGLWRRRLYVEPAAGPSVVEDTTTEVYWLQTGLWHADLRIPVGMPDFTGVGSLADCDRMQLIWIAGLTAFAGRTIVEGRFCTWHRLVDMAPGLDKDIGGMQFLSDRLLEEQHPDGRYLERWEKVASGDATGEVARIDEAGLPVWLQQGAHAFRIVPRPSLEADHELLEAPETLAGAALARRAATEVSYLCRDADGWRVARSTHPWRIGDLCEAPDAR